MAVGIGVLLCSLHQSSNYSFSTNRQQLCLRPDMYIIGAACSVLIGQWQSHSYRCHTVLRGAAVAHWLERLAASGGHESCAYTAGAVRV